MRHQTWDASGKDYVTLLTCTPIGINTHRLLVRGERIPLDELSADEREQVVAAAPFDPGFPWWAFGLAGGLALAIVIAYPRRLRADATSDAVADEHDDNEDDGGSPGLGRNPKTAD